MKTRLAVNIDHVATLRQARRAAYPDPVAAARIAEEAGATGITVHLRSDRRHIQDDDVRRLRPVVRGTLNLEIATTAEMLELAVAVRPDQVSLVPERPEEITTEGGLDLRGRREEVVRAAESLRDPDPAQLEACATLPAGLVRGFEINTDAYTRAPTDRRDAELAKVARAAALGAEQGLQVYAGHGLTTANVGPIAAIPQIEELNIGHWLISHAVTVGLAGAVREMLAAMED
jgi:pyridoxine 5-phosphate synthase